MEFLSIVFAFNFSYITNMTSELTTGPQGVFINPSTGDEITVDIGQIEKDRTPTGTFTHTDADGKKVVFKVGAIEDQKPEV